MRRLTVSLLMLTQAGLSRADCMPQLFGTIRLTAEVASCQRVEAPAPDHRFLMKLAVRRSAVTIVASPDDAPEILALYEELADAYGNRNIVFVETASSSTSGADCSAYAKGSMLKASVDEMCCDVLPFTGLCALPYPSLLVHPDPDTDAMPLPATAR